MSHRWHSSVALSLLGSSTVYCCLVCIVTRVAQHGIVVLSAVFIVRSPEYIVYLATYVVTALLRFDYISESQCFPTFCPWKTP